MKKRAGRRRLFLLPAKGRVGRDVGAGLTLGLVSVPDGLASGILAGVNPITGLYGYLVGTVTGALSTSSVVMSVQGTGAMAVLIASIPEIANPDTQAPALVTLGVMTGIVMVMLGVFRLGSLVRFVPNAVLVGFISAVAVNIVLGQLSGLTGYRSSADNRVVRAIDTFLHVGLFDWPTVAVGLATLGLIVALERTKLGSMGLVIAVVLSSASVVVFGLYTVSQLQDISSVPNTLPLPVFPDLSFVLPLLIPALSLAFVGLVQGAAISQSIPNPDGKYPKVSADFQGQGIANIASGVFQGVPVGGSMSATSLVVTAGGKSRMVNLIAGAVMILVILFLGPVSGMIAMPALAALLLLVGIRTLKPSAIKTVWRTGVPHAIVLTLTFILTISIPLQYAVLIGIGMSALFFVVQQSNNIVVRQWTFLDEDMFPIESDPPETLAASEVVILSAYGSPFFASTSVFHSQLPKITSASRGSAIVLRFRGKESFGSTFIAMLNRYAQELDAVDSSLLICGISPRVYDQLVSTKAVKVLGEDNIFEATDLVGESLKFAQARAASLVRKHGGSDPSIAEEPSGDDAGS